MKKKILRITTVPSSLNTLLFGQFLFLRDFFDIIAVSSPGIELSELSKREQIRTIELKMRRDVSIFYDIISLYKMVKLILVEKPFIIHANTPKASLISMTASYLCNVPHRVYTITGLRFETEKGFQKKFLIFFEKVTCFFANQIIAEGIDVKNLMLEYSLTSKKIQIIGHGNINGIDEKYWNPILVKPITIDEYKNKLNIKINDFIFIYIGRINKDKGILELYNSFNKVKMSSSNVKLIIVGENEFNNNSIICNNTENIIHLGFRNDIRELLSISNVLILPSYREGFPNVILQALSMGLPCISTNVNGSRQVINDSNGLLIPTHSEEALTKAMIEIQKNYYKYNGACIRKDIISKFSQNYYYPQLLNYYNQLSLS